eukprot:TRINITY_DN9033_c0_g1_i4.p1 TRINITY_DN9033_c0_g1~~TRINITY_DN9033_c0_g1_i4.p1  ORF type:complete len:306 (+),score=36.32 TRINITY_DN9033_c0_g1_i4:154-1071(+)
MFMFILLLALPLLTSAQECQTFASIYGNGENLCNRMFGDAFVYSTDLDNAYTMWFFDAVNPNDDISVRRNLTQSRADDCKLEFFHKTAPSPEPDSFTECHPWKDYSCCSQQTVETATKLKESYGPEYHWDRCGALTPACERFFVQEACFYECEPSAGFFRRFPKPVFDPSNETHNAWELYQMPIRADYCNAWFDACRHDRFCASDGGNYFSCARIYRDNQTIGNGTGIEQSSDDDLSSGVIVGIVVAVVAAVGLLGFSLFLIYRERKGTSVFAPLEQQDTAVSGLGHGMPNSLSYSPVCHPCVCI